MSLKEYINFQIHDRPGDWPLVDVMTGQWGVPRPNYYGTETPIPLDKAWDLHLGGCSHGERWQIRIGIPYQYFMAIVFRRREKKRSWISQTSQDTIKSPSLRERVSRLRVVFPLIEVKKTLSGTMKNSSTDQTSTTS